MRIVACHDTRLRKPGVRHQCSRELDVDRCMSDVGVIYRLEGNMSAFVPQAVHLQW
jgi:hypothetical protein